MKRIPFFRAGRHRSKAGDELTFSEADLRRSAKVYDPSIWRAPLVIGHPTTDAPAYGWVDRVEFSNGTLVAIPGPDLEPQFAEMVRSGRFPNRSASFYSPGHPDHPLKGTEGADAYYPRHIGFLGAEPPAIKGLPRPQFSASDEGVVEVEFAEGAGDEAGLVRQLVALFRRALGSAEFAEDTAPRGGYAGPHGSFPMNGPKDAENCWNLAGHAADPEAVRRKVVEIAKRMGWTDALPDTAHAWAKAHGIFFSESEVTTVTKEELDARAAEIAKREQAVAAKETEFSERETAITNAERRARRQSATEFVENFVSGERKGSVLPREKAGLIELLNFCEGAGGKTLEFAEGEETVKKTPGALLREFIEGLGERVDFSERSRGAGTETGKTPRLADRVKARYTQGDAAAAAGAR